VTKAISKLRLLERGLLDEAKALDDINFTEGTSKIGESQKEGAEESAAIAKIGLYVQYCFQAAPQAKRGDYKDGSVFQARKAAIEEFMTTALGSSKKCQREGCGA
jgi:DNA-directed RNA polymerase I subunit RPA1